MNQNSKAVNKDDKNTAQNTSNHEDVSMEEILKSIKGVISGEDQDSLESMTFGDDSEDYDEEDILELTQEADDDQTSKSDLKGYDKDILNEIDEALELTDDETELDNSDVEEVSDFSINKDFEELHDEDEDSLQELLGTSKQANEQETATKSYNRSDLNDLAESSKLIQQEVALESSNAIRELVDVIPKSNINSPYTKGGVTLEELTIEAMKPFLSKWLNENLPTIVRQIVTKEVKKLIPDDDEKK
jgi:hypothetical protein